MDDRIRRVLSGSLHQDKNKNLRHLQPDQEATTAHEASFAARPHISLKARMLGGQAETIMRLRGFMR